MALSAQLFSTGRTSGGRALIAFFVAPLVSSIITIAVTVLLLLGRMPAGDNPPDALQVVVMSVVTIIWAWLVMGVPWTMMGMAVVGLPTYFLLRVTRNESGLAYGGLGALGGYWLAPQLGGHKWDWFPLDFIGAAAGAMTMLLFWRWARAPYGVDPGPWRGDS